MRLRPASAIATLFVIGCGPEPTFEEVAPVLEARCLGCHRPDGASPPLHDPTVLTAIAPQALAAVAEGTMPAWAPDDDVHPLRDSTAIAADERRTLVRWLRAGASVPPGSELHAPPRPTIEADLRLSLPPSTGASDALRCVLVDLPDTHLVGFDVLADASVHHVLLGVHPVSDRAALEALDAADPEPGWACDEHFMGTKALTPARVPVLWFPSPAPTRMFPGTGVPLGGVGVLQVHALGPGAGGELLLALDDEVADEIALTLGTGDVPLPEDQDQVVVTRKAHLGDLLPEDLDTPVRILGGRGHGHELLARLTIRLDDDPVLDLVRWDPRVQPRYLLQEPVLATADQVVELTCTYDTTAEDRARAAEYGDEGEMCGGWLFVAER